MSAKSKPAAKETCGISKLSLCRYGAELITQAYPQTMEEISRIIDRHVTKRDINEFVKEIEEADRKRQQRELEEKGAKPEEPMFQTKEQFAEFFINLWDKLDDRCRNHLAKSAEYYATFKTEQEQQAS